MLDARRGSHASASAASHASISFDLSPWMHALRGFKPTKLRAKSSEASRARAKALALVRVRDATMRDAGRDVWVCLAQLINGDAITEELRGAVPASVEERFELCKRALESCERQSESKPGPPWSRKRAMYGFLIEQWHTRDDFLIVDVECTESAAGMAENYEFTLIWKDGATSRLTWNDFKTLQTRVLDEEREKRFISLLKPVSVVGEVKVKVEDASPVGAAATMAVETTNDEEEDEDEGVVVEPSDADSESVRGTEEEEPEVGASDDTCVGMYVDQNALPCVPSSTQKVQPCLDGLLCSKQLDVVQHWMKGKQLFCSKQAKRKLEGVNEEVRRAKPKPKPKEKPRRETKTSGEVGPFYNCRSFVEMSETPRDNPEDDDEVEDARQDETDLQMLHEFVDFSLEEIDFMASWNVVARRFRVMTNDDVPLLCKSFAKTYAEKLLKDSEFYDKFVYTLTNLFDSGVVNRVNVVDVLRFAERALPVGRRPPKSSPSTRATGDVL